MLRLWDELLDLHFTLPGGTLEEVELTSTQRFVTRQDGLRRLVALAKPEYPAEASLFVQAADLDADGLVAPSTWYYLANWLAYCLQANRMFRVFQADELFGCLRVFKCYVKESLPRELAAFLNLSASAAGAQTPLAMADGPRLPLVRPWPDDFEFFLHLVEDGVWIAYFAAYLGHVNKSLIFTARSLDFEHALTVNYTGVFPTADLSVRYVDPGGNNQPLWVAVRDNDGGAELLRTEKVVHVSLATGPAGAITSTAAQVKAEVEGNAEAADLVEVELWPGGDGSGVVTALAKSFITGWSGRALTGTAFTDRGY